MTFATLRAYAGGEGGGGGGPVLAHAATHATGGGDAVTLTQAQITGLSAALTAKADASTTTAALSGKASTATTISTTAPLSGGGSLAANRTLSVAPFSTTTTDPGVVPGSAGAATTNFLRADGTWGVPAGGGGGSLVDDSVTNAFLANVATNTIKGRVTAATGDPQDLTPAQARTVIASDSGGGTTNYLRADGTWAAPPGGASGITVAEGGSALDTDITTLDFGIGFDLTETPENEVNIALDLSEYTGAPLPVANGGTGSVSAGSALTALGAAASARVIATTAPLTGGGDLTGSRTLDISTFTLTVKGAVPPPTTATGKFLKDDGTWAAPTSSGAPVRRTLNAQTGTTFAPVVADENTMVTLSNAAAVTVTLPSNGTQAFPVGAEVDFLWLGVGQPTFVAGSGATVNATPGLKLRGRYSAATAKKIGTDAWVCIGDLAT